MVRIIRRSGKIEERGESLGEFSAKLTAERIKSRGLSRREKNRAKTLGVTQQQIVQSLQQKAATAKALQIPKGTKVVKKASGQLVFQRLIRTRQGLVIKERPISSIKKELRVTTITIGKQNKPIKLFLDTASGTLLESLTRTGATVPIPQRFAGQQSEAQKIKTVFAGAAKTIQRKFRDNGDLESARTINKLVEKGLFGKSQRKIFENKLKKQEVAIKKIELINKKIEGFNKNYDKAVLPILNFLEKTPRVRLKRDGTKINVILKPSRKPDSFSDKVATRVLVEGSKFLNPFIVGTEISAALESFRVAKEAGLTSIPQISKKLGRTIRDDPQKIIKAFENLAKKLDPRTVEGLSNIIIISVLIGAPSKIIKGASKVGTALIKTGSKTGIHGLKAFFNANKSLVKEIKAVVKGLVSDKSASLRGARRITGKVSKAELRKRNVIREIGRATRQQAKGFARTKAERKALLTVTKRKPAKELVLIQTRTGVGVFRGKTRQPLFSVKVKGKPLFTKQAKSVVSKSTTDAFKGSGNQVLLTVQKQSKRTKRRIKGKKKVPVTKQAQKIDQRAATRTFESLSGKRSPTATVIYEDFVAVPPETLTKGWRSLGIKNQIINRISKVKADLQVRKAIEVKKAVVASKIVRKVDELKLRSLLQRPTLSFSTVQGVFRLVTSPALALKLNNSLRLISLLNFAIIRVNIIRQNVQSIPIAVLKPDVKIEPVIIEKEKIKEPRPIPTPRKPKITPKKRKRLPATRRIITPRVTQPVPRRLRKIPLIKKKPIKKRRLILRPRLRKLKRKEINIIKSLLKVIPKKFRPSLKAVVLGITAAKIPSIITGLELRPIIIKLIKEKEEELKKKLKKLKKGVKKRGKKRKVKRVKGRRK